MNNNIQDFFNNQEEQEKLQQQREEQQKKLGAETIESHTSIRQQVTAIRKFVIKNKNKTTFDEDIAKEFADFKLKYPTLFKKLSENNCDPKQLDMMLDKLEQVQTSRKTQYDASVEVGQVLVDKFVKPKLEEKQRHGRNRNNNL